MQPRLWLQEYIYIQTDRQTGMHKLTQKAEFLNIHFRVDSSSNSIHFSFNSEFQNETRNYKRVTFIDSTLVRVSRHYYRLTLYCSMVSALVIFTRKGRVEIFWEWRYWLWVWVRVWVWSFVTILSAKLALCKKFT